MSSQATVAWLKAASALIVGFGIITVSATIPAAAGLARFLIDMIFWPIDGAQTLAAPETRLLCAIAGGLMTGWGAMLWLAATRLYPQAPELAGTMIMVSLATWFIVDSLGSILAGAPLNAVLNMGFLPIFLIPLMRGTRRAEA